MKTVLPKKRGRPATGRDPLVPVRLPPALLRSVESWASRYEGMSRSTALRCLIDLGLHVPKKRVAKIVDPKEQFGDWKPPKTYERVVQPKPTRPRAVKATPPDETEEPKVYGPRHSRQSMDVDMVRAIADRAERGAKKIR